jgi:hypothetical protein
MKRAAITVRIDAAVTICPAIPTGILNEDPISINNKLDMINLAWVANPVINNDASIKFLEEKIFGLDTLETFQNFLYLTVLSNYLMVYYK